MTTEREVAVSAGAALERIGPNDVWPEAVSDGLSLACSDCGVVPRFDYRVSEAFWRRWVPGADRLSVVCLPCLDRRCGGVGLVEALERVVWTGTGHSVVMEPSRRIDYSHAPAGALAMTDQRITGADPQPRTHEHHWVGPDHAIAVEHCGICGVPRHHEHHVHEKRPVSDCPECVAAATSFLETCPNCQPEDRCYGWTGTEGFPCNLAKGHDGLHGFFWIESGEWSPEAPWPLGDD